MNTHEEKPLKTEHEVHIHVHMQNEPEMKSTPRVTVIAHSSVSPQDVFKALKEFGYA